MKIENILRDSPQDKVKLKIGKIVKSDHKGTFFNEKYGLTIEVVSDAIISENEKGIELYAKAWKDGVQLGFGTDGTVEIERFRFFNPPILVDNPNGGIIRESVDSITGETHKLVLKEDPVQAIREALAHTINIVAKDGVNIIKDKKGNTTSTFYPDANPESTTVDGRIYRNNVPDATWSACRDATNGNGSDDTSTFENVIFSAFQSSRYDNHRYFSLFDTSAITDSDTIDSATYSLFKNSTDAGSNDDSTSIELVQTNPASNTALTTADYDALTFTSGGSKNLPFTDSAYNDITVNATGLSWISKTGITKLGAITGRDLNNSAPTGLNTPGNLRTADFAGTSSDPALVVVHSTATASATPNLRLLMMGVG